MKRFRWKKGEQVTADGVIDIQSAIREFTEPRDNEGNLLTDPEDNDADVQYAKVNIEVIVKTYRERRSEAPPAAPGASGKD